jgi:uncharacterized SAM-binding protein YcdF (DUF218 family)
MLVRVIERGRQWIHVDGERPRARAAKRRDDVDALPCASEEDAEAAHDARGYRRPVLRRLLAALVILVGLWLVAVAVLFVWPQADTGPPAHADAVVVLSGGGNWRLDPALKLVERGVAPILAISSPFRDQRWTKAHRLCRGQDGRLPFKVVCFQAVPYSTRGEAETVARLAQHDGWTRIVVVTSEYHVTRARMLFRRCYRGSLWMLGTSSPWLSLPEEWASETAKLTVQAVYEHGC